jgi:RNA 2',3'-cyclic 3'-phosphodiesterase
VRCFVAVDLSPDVRDAIAHAQAGVRAAAARADVRWVDPAQLHLTLKFLGAVPDDRVPAVSRALEAAVAPTPPIALAAAGLGGFPSLGRPRVLWAGVAAGASELALLADAVDRALVPLGFPPESRPFRGHLTIGRVRSPRGGRALAAAVEAARAPAFGAWTAAEVVLYESRLRPTGAVYAPVSCHPLRGVRA